MPDLPSECYMIPSMLLVGLLGASSAGLLCTIDEAANVVLMTAKPSSHYSFMEIWESDRVSRKILARALRGAYIGASIGLFCWFANEMIETPNTKKEEVVVVQ